MGPAGADSDAAAALSLVERGEYDAAVARVKATLAVNPDSSAAHEVLGVALAKKGLLDEALREFKHAAGLAPKASTPWTKMGDVYLAKNDSENAKSCLLQAVALDPKDYRAHQRLGLIFEQERDVPLAIEHFEKGIVGPPPDYIGVKVDLATLYNQTRQFARSASLLESVVHSNTPNPAAHFALGTAYLGLRRTDDAIRSFSFMEKFDRDPARAEVAKGIAFREAGDLTRSLKELDAAIKAKPDWSLGHYEQGETLLAMRKLPEAIQSFSAAAAHNPKPVHARNRIAEILAAEKQYDSSAQAYEKLRSEGIADWKTYDGLATVYQVSGRLDAAKKVLLEACEKWPVAPVFLRLGLFYGYTKQYGPAKESLTTARGLSPADPRILKALSGVSLRTGDLTNAIALARKLLEIVPNSVDDMVYLAALLGETGSYEEAASGSTQALELNPKQLLAFNNLAVIQMKLGKLDEALKSANQAVALAPEDATVLDTLGWILYKRAEFAKAKPVSRKPR